MGKTWVLRTETKGTGAHVVPLEEVLKQPVSEAEPRPVLPKRRAKKAETRGPSAPQKFKIVDVMSQQVLAEGATTSETVDLLEGIRSIVDVRMYVWDDKTERWRLLNFAQEKALWELRGR
jgi:hypothetical protein